MAERPLETDDDAGTVPPADMESPTVDAGLDVPPQSQRGDVRGPVILRQRYLVDSGAPLPALDSPSAMAFNVEDQHDFGRKMFGLICTPDLPTRLDSMRFLKNDLPRGILPFADWDVVYWPPLGQNTTVVIYDQPLGGRVVTRLADKDTKITEYDVARHLVEPLLTPIQYLSETGSAHRAIRADNLFFMDEAMTEIVFGDFVTAPPGFDQPIMYEPIERAMTTMSGRGRGTVKDDIFALGVTIGVLVLGHNPMAKVTDQDQVRRRQELGSFTALFGETRIPIPMLEPMRGMINDDPDGRWGIAEVSNWLSGQRSKSPTRKSRTKADTPFAFRGHGYNNPKVLAAQFCANVPEAARVIREEAFAAWVLRSLGDKKRAEAVKNTVQNAHFYKDGYQGSDDYIVAKIAIILDDSAPIRYLGYNFMPDGYGPLVALEAAQNGNQEIAAQLLSRDIPAMWLTLQDPPFHDTPMLNKTFAKLKGFLSINDPGYGVERLLYEINPSLPCLSPVLQTSCVVTIEHLLPALDLCASHSDTSQLPVDRHIAAFIAARFDEDIHPHLKAIASAKQEISIIGVLSLLAFLQWKLRQPAGLGLCSWVGGLLGPVINSYHNRKTRKQLEKDVPVLVRKGSLTELFDLVDNAERRRTDRRGYMDAQREWLDAEQEIREIQGAGDERIIKAERTGQQTAATISVVLAMSEVAILLLVKAV